MTEELAALQWKERAPGGSSHGIMVSRKKRVIGVVFHINLPSQRRR